jgi:F0F1-type ATP synthase assembly protein I
MNRIWLVLIGILLLLGIAMTSPWAGLLVAFVVGTGVALILITRPAPPDEAVAA